jgi:hypothetical protein
MQTGLPVYIKSGGIAASVLLAAAVAIAAGRSGARRTGLA